MAINKTVNKSSKSHGAMRNCIEYVLRDHKTTDGYVYMTGPAPETLTWDSVYQAFLEEKKIWKKDNGRMYSHNIISFHRDEAIAYVLYKLIKLYIKKWSRLSYWILLISFTIVVIFGNLLKKFISWNLIIVFFLIQIIYSIVLGYLGMCKPD